MKVVAKVKLKTESSENASLLTTMMQANELCNKISQHAWEQKIFRQYDLHKSYYAIARSESRLSSQMVIRSTARVADAYKLDKKTMRTFNPYGAVAYDLRILKWNTIKKSVSIWAIGGRLKISYECGPRQDHYLQYQLGESDLVYYKNEFYLFATCDIPDPLERDVEGVLGIDLGIINLATDSDGTIYSGARIEFSRKRYQDLRAALQSKGTRSAKRHLRKLSGRQKRFQQDSNHVVSKHIVEDAVRTNRSIAVEKLTGIRSRTRVNGSNQRGRHSNWSFYQLKQFIAYKARMAGIPLIEVDPRNTSRRCFVCGHTAKENRKSQSEFVCTSCGHAANADHNAARNISWAAINQPIVLASQGARHKLPALAGSN